jgi:DNA adenine methylase
LLLAAYSEVIVDDVVGPLDSRQLMGLSGFVMRERGPRMAVLGQQPLAGLEPLFRWPGGKRWLVSQLAELLPDAIGTYYEPFFGAGALFFAVQPSSAVLSDSNAELMDAYRSITQTPHDVAGYLRGLPRDRDGYYSIRAANPTDPAQRAARFIYLTTLAFNGIYRVNQQGLFNVPYGGRRYEGLGLDGSLLPYAAALKQADLQTGDFEAVLEGASSGDFAYLDPPYTVAHGNNGFLRYNEKIFSWRDQERLAAVAIELDRRGCHLVVSNAAHSSIRALFKRFRSIPVSRQSRIAASPSRRLLTGELIFTNVG